MDTKELAFRMARSGTSSSSNSSQQNVEECANAKFQPSLPQPEAAPKTPDRKTHTVLEALSPPSVSPLARRKTELPSAPQTPPDILLSRVPGDGKQMSGSPPEFKKMRMSICDKQVESQQDNGDTSRKFDEENQTMNIDEQRVFLEALSRAMKSLKENFEEVTVTMIRNKQWLLLEAIQDSTDVLAACLSEEHAGVPGCLKKSTASKTIAGACNDFEATPLLRQCLVHLKEWDGRRSPACVLSILTEFSEAWSCDWERQKEALVRLEQFGALQQLVDTKQKLSAVLTHEGQVDVPDRHQALQELCNLKAMECFDAWPGLDKAIQELQD